MVTNYNVPFLLSIFLGVEVGTVWPMRIDCNAAGIHRLVIPGIIVKTV